FVIAFAAGVKDGRNTRRATNPPAAINETAAPAASTARSVLSRRSRLRRTSASSRSTSRSDRLGAMCLPAAAMRRNRSRSSLIPKPLRDEPLATGHPPLGGRQRAAAQLRDCLHGLALDDVQSERQSILDRHLIQDLVDRAQEHA